MLINSPITDNSELDAYLYSLKLIIEDIIYENNIRKINSFTGTFPTNDGRTATVVEGIITNIE